MIFLISVPTTWRGERSSEAAGSAAILRQIIPSRIWRTASYHWARISPLTLAKSWSRLSARSVLQKVNGLLRSPQATRTSLHSCSGRGPSILLRKTVLSLKSPTGAFIAALRKRELLRTRHFRQCVRKNNENFGKKREGWTVPALLTRKNTRLFIIIKL